MSPQTTHFLATLSSHTTLPHPLQENIRDLIEIVLKKMVQCSLCTLGFCQQATVPIMLACALFCHASLRIVLSC
jgi:hypothetical protein